MLKHMSHIHMSTEWWSFGEISVFCFTECDLISDRVQSKLQEWAKLINQPTSSHFGIGRLILERAHLVSCLSFNLTLAIEGGFFWIHPIFGNYLTYQLLFVQCILPNKPLACPIVSFWDHCTTHYYSGLCSNVTVVMLAPWGLLSASTTCAPQSHDPHSLQTLTLVTNKRPPRSCGFTPPFLWLYNPLFTVRSFSGGDPGVSSLDWIEGEIEGCLWGFCGCTNHILANNFGFGSNATADNHLAMINTASNVQAMNTNSSPHIKLGVFLFNLIAHSFNGYHLYSLLNSLELKSSKNMFVC